MNVGNLMLKVILGPILQTFRERTSREIVNFEFCSHRCHPLQCLYDMSQRGFNLLDMPASTTLKAKVRKEMIPSDMKSSETVAEFDISVALIHTGQRFLERPDIRQHLKDGDTVKHLAKVGSDFATGFGKVQQVKQSDVDEDGSHNTGFQTLKRSCGEQDICQQGTKRVGAARPRIARQHTRTRWRGWWQRWRLLTGCAKKFRSRRCTLKVLTSCRLSITLSTLSVVAKHGWQYPSTRF